jgi:hypothetical protein
MDARGADHARGFSEAEIRDSGGVAGSEAMTRAFFALILFALTLADAHAQTNASAPILRTTVDPPRVVVGQKTTLRIELLAPNYMTAPPELPDFQVRNAVTRQSQSININEQRDGITYAGVRFEFAVYPQEPGSYAIAGKTITVHYAAEPPVTRDAELALPRIEFAAFIPDGATALRPFVAASKLTVEQTVQRSSDALKTGDAVTRTITIKAEGTPAMLLPPLAFSVVDGLALYPAQPSLDDHTDARTDLLTAMRADSATYMLQRPGNYELPAIDVNWWNIDAQRIERAHLDAVMLDVAANPSMPVAAATEPNAGLTWDGVVDLLWEHWLLATIALLALGAIAWISPRIIRTLVVRRRRQRERWLQSEAFSFHQFCRATRGCDARVAYFALLNWLQRFKTVVPIDGVGALKTETHDPLLDFEINSVEQELFSRNPPATRWSPQQLTWRVGAARRALRRQAHHKDSVWPLPQQLNPIGDDTGAGRKRRLPAR